MYLTDVAPKQKKMYRVHFGIAIPLQNRKIVAIVLRQKTMNVRAALPPGHLLASTQNRYISQLRDTKFQNLQIEYIVRYDVTFLQKEIIIIRVQTLKFRTP